MDWIQTLSNLFGIQYNTVLLIIIFIVIILFVICCICIRSCINTICCPCICVWKCFNCCLDKVVRRKNKNKYVKGIPSEQNKYEFGDTLQP